MNWLVFVFWIFLILFLIGLVKIKFYFCFKENFGQIILKILFFKLCLFSTEKSKDKDAKLKKKSKKVKNKKSNDDKIKKKKDKVKKKQSISEKVDLFFLVLKPTVNLLKFLNRGFKIKKLSLNLQIASDDACKTAVLYGRFCCFFYSFFKFLKSIFHIEVSKMYVMPRFDVDKLYYDVSLYMQIAISRLFVGVLKYFFIIFVKILLYKIKNSNKKERLN